VANNAPAMSCVAEMIMRAYIYLYCVLQLGSIKSRRKGGLTAPLGYQSSSLVLLFNTTLPGQSNGCVEAAPPSDDLLYSNRQYREKANIV
jgi:hypothetical protein